MGDLNELRHQYVEDHLVDARWHEIVAAGVTCDVLEAGHGSPLVLVHGGMAACTQWVPLMARLEKDFCCYAVERPSHGASGKFDYPDRADDRLRHVTTVIGDLLDGIGLDHAPIVGNSLGGLFALGFATQHPRRVDHLILAGAPAAHDHPVPLAVRFIGGRVAGPLMSLMMRRMRPKDVRKGEGQLLLAHPERLADDYLEVVAATTRHNADVWPAYMRWALQGDTIHPDMPSTDWAAEVAEAGVPITYIWGDRDQFVPLDKGRRFAKSIGASFVEIPDAGHLVWLDQTDQVANTIVEILHAQDATATRPDQDPQR